MVAIKVETLSDSELESLIELARKERGRRAEFLECLQKVPNWKKALDYLVDVSNGETSYEEHLIEACRRRLVTHRPTFKKTIDKAINVAGELSNLVCELSGNWDDCNEWNRLASQLDRLLTRLG